VQLKRLKIMIMRIIATEYYRKKTIKKIEKWHIEEINKIMTTGTTKTKETKT
jgi:hypothetical protein